MVYCLHILYSQTRMFLSDFFQPLLPFNIFIFVSLFFFFDIVGSFVIEKILRFKIDLQKRIAVWLVGFGSFIFLWFIASLSVAYTKSNILISIAILTLITLPNYIKNNGFKSFVISLKKAWIPILIILPFLPAVFVKASLPPYYGDEMAYQYISPFTMLNLTPVKYIGGLYADLPRSLNLLWEIIFSLTNTYSIARLFHFTILATGLIYTFNTLKKNFGLIAGFLFVFLFLSLPQDIVLTSTVGYIDVGAYIFLLMGIVSATDFVRNPSRETIGLTTIFWSMNLGTKYTGLTAFISFFVAFGILALFSWQKYRKFFTIKLTTYYLLLFVVIGGYWYIKNFILYGNPTFPFIFNCWGNHVEPCGQAGAFFGNWTTKVNLENAKLIVSQLFIGNKILQVLVFTVPFFALFVKNHKVKYIILALIGSLIIEISYLKYFSGFYVRYHQHMQLILLLIIILTLLNTSKMRIIDLIRKLVLATLILFSAGNYFLTAKHTNSLNFLNLTEISYAINKIDIYDWIHFNFFDMKEVIEWCERPEKVNLARYDPDLIWFEHNGLSRVFMLRCNFENPNVDTTEIDKIIPSAITNKQKFWLVSTAKCLKDNEVKPKFDYEQPYQFYLRRVNNKIICNSGEIKPNLYYFDYQKVK